MGLEGRSGGRLLQWGQCVELRSLGLWRGQWEPQEVLDRQEYGVLCNLAVWKTDRRERDWGWGFQL